MSDKELTPERVTALTAAVDIEASPPDGEPVALVLFGTNQAAPAQIAAARYHAGTAPLVIATGGVNRHNGIIEGREFARQLTQAGVPGDVIRVEDQSKDTWQNVELSLPHLREALAMGLRLVVVSKWYHLRTVYCLATLLPEAVPFHAISWEPGYDAGDGSLAFGGWIWRYDLAPTGPSETEVTLTYDWSAVPEPIRERIGFPQFPPDHLGNSLDHLAELVAS